MRLKDKVAIITGAGSGQGRATSLIFAREGAAVVICDWNEAGARETERLIREAVPDARTLVTVTDVSDEQSVRDMVQATMDSFGRIDILFNNAGIGYSFSSRYKMANLLDTPLSDWNAILGINLNGVYLCSKHVLPIMRAQRSGSIINNSSMNGLVGVSGADAYTAAKGGVVSLTRVMAVDNGPYNIRVNCIAPGAIDTPMIADVLKDPAVRDHFAEAPLGRIGRPEEIGYAALFLASDEASYITGVILPVDGGWNAK
ncbi:MAG: SDR family oxidoreductase [Alicyclobacillus sp.]|nr:SDR family oxidoreductase [Alicyclobacillus sp.]